MICCPGYFDWRRRLPLASRNPPRVVAKSFGGSDVPSPDPCRPSRIHSCLRSKRANRNCECFDSPERQSAYGSKPARNHPDPGERELRFVRKSFQLSRGWTDLCGTALRLRPHDGPGRHNVVFVATEYDSVYAFDADSAATNPKPLWHVNFLNPPGVAPVSCAQGAGICQLFPVVGITSTPVINLSTNTLYVVAR